MTSSEAELVEGIVSSPESDESAKLEEITNTIIDSVFIAGGRSARSLAQGTTLYVDDEKLKELFNLIKAYGKEN